MEPTEEKRRQAMTELGVRLIKAAASPVLPQEYVDLRRADAPPPCPSAGPDWWWIVKGSNLSLGCADLIMLRLASRGMDPKD